VARREAPRLKALEHKEREAVRGEDLTIEPVDPRDRHAEILEFRAAIDQLKKLPPLLKEVVVIHSQSNRWVAADDRTVEVHGDGCVVRVVRPSRGRQPHSLDTKVPTCPRRAAGNSRFLAAR